MVESSSGRIEVADQTDRKVFWGLLSLLFWCPLPIASNRPWAIGILVLASIWLLFLALYLWRNHTQLVLARLIRFKVPIGLLFAIVVLSWLQVVPLPKDVVMLLSPTAARAHAPADWLTLSVDVYRTQLMASLSFAYLCVFIVTVLVVRNQERLETLAQTLVYSGVFQAVLGSVLYSFNAIYTIFYVPVRHDRMIGSFVYHNSAAGYLCMCLSIGIGLMLARLGSKPSYHPNWKSRMVAVMEFVLSPKMRLRLLLVVMVIALVLTRSRMGNSAFFAAMLIVGGFAVVFARKTAPHTMALIISLIIVDIFVVGSLVGLEKVAQRLQDTELTADAGGKSESVETRTEAGRLGLGIVQDYPVVGSGAGSFYNLFWSYRTADFTSLTWDHAHNDFVEIAADYGFTGLLLFGALVALTFSKVINVMTKRRSSLPWGISFGVAMAMTCLLIHSAVDFNLQIPSNALTIVVILAMGWLALELPSPKRKRRSTNKELVL